MEKHNGEDRANLSLDTIFLDNLPAEIRQTWLTRIFSHCGRVSYASIPNKRRQRSGSRFGFVKFTNEEDAAVAIKRYNGGCCLDRRLFVDKAIVAVNNNRPNFNFRKEWRIRHQRDKEDGTQHSMNLTKQLGQRYPNVMENREEEEDIIVASEIDDAWTKACAIGIVMDQKFIAILEEATKQEGVLYNLQSC